MNKSRSRAYNRDVSKRKALRKKRLAEEVYYNGKEYPYYNNLHQYSKNKIHYSAECYKTRNKGNRRWKRPHNWSRSLNYKASDLRRQVSMDYEENEYIGNTHSGMNGPKRKKDW